uniref:Uncharacterized protein n=1 Tax=Setaria italica TaxID=4555 RepID=K3Z228_SETIT
MRGARRGGEHAGADVSVWEMWRGRLPVPQSS